VVSFHAPVALLWRQSPPPPPSIHLITGWVGHKAGREVLGKRKIVAFTGIKPQFLRPPVRSHHTKYAIPGILASVILCEFRVIKSKVIKSLNKHLRE